MSPALTRRGIIQAGAVALGAAVLPVGLSQAAPAFDLEAFVDGLLDAGCRVSVHSPIGRDAGPSYVYVFPGSDGIPTAGEREVRSR